MGGRDLGRRQDPFESIVREEWCESMVRNPLWALGRVAHRVVPIPRMGFGIQLDRVGFIVGERRNGACGDTVLGGGGNDRWYVTWLTGT